MPPESKAIILEQGFFDGQGKELAAPPTTEELDILLGPAEHDLAALSAALPGPLYLAGSGSSSFDLAHELIRQGKFTAWAAVLLAGQSAGRGQLRRPWTSQPGNLFVSYQLPALACHANAVPIVTGLLWTLGLIRLGYAVQLKWPNDLVQSGSRGLEKIGGILIEERNGAVVAGVGLNLRQAPPTSSLRQDHATPAGLLARPKQLADSVLLSFYADKRGIAHFWTKLAAVMFSCYSAASDKNLDWWRPLAESVLAYSGRLVEIADHNVGQSIRGVVAGLHHDGSLLLRTGREIISISGGSLRPVSVV